MQWLLVYSGVFPGGNLTNSGNSFMYIKSDLRARTHVLSGPYQCLYFKLEYETFEAEY